jgi:hypothetical protein
MKTPIRKERHEEGNRMDYPQSFTKGSSFGGLYQLALRNEKFVLVFCFKPFKGLNEMHDHFAAKLYKPIGKGDREKL